MYVNVVYTNRAWYCIYMAKKYLLYIHNKAFETETEKSGIVNRLLDNYYKEAKDYPVLPDIIKTPKEAKIKTDELRESKNIKTNTDGTLSPIKESRPVTVKYTNNWGA